MVSTLIQYKETILKSLHKDIKKDNIQWIRIRSFIHLKLI